MDWNTSLIIVGGIVALLFLTLPIGALWRRIWLAAYVRSMKARHKRQTTLVVATRGLVTVNDVLELDGQRFRVLAINQNSLTMTLKAL